MKRLAFNLATAVLLPLFLVAVAGWVRSHYVADEGMIGDAHWYRSADGAIRWGDFVVIRGGPRPVVFPQITGKIYYVSPAAALGAVPFLRLLVWAIERERRTKAAAAKRVIGGHGAMPVSAQPAPATPAPDCGAMPTQPPAA